MMLLFDATSLRVVVATAPSLKLGQPSRLALFHMLQTKTTAGQATLSWLAGLFRACGKRRSKDPMRNMTRPFLLRMTTFVILSVLVPAGCAAIALPFRVTADVVRVIPVVGDAVAVPFDAVGNFVDD
jgi:hypothetical protein